MHRTTARLAALGSTTALALTLAAGTASAGGYGGDDRCEHAKGVVVCTPIDADLSGLDLDVLNILNGHGHH